MPQTTATDLFRGTIDVGRAPLHNPIMNRASPATPKAEPTLQALLDRLYMGGCSFMPALADNPAEAIARLQTDPAQFGQLRNYVGPIMLKRNLKRVIHLARQRLITPQVT